MEKLTQNFLNGITKLTDVFTKYSSNILQTHYITSDFVSDPNNGAFNISALGSEFSINQTPPLIIPSNARNVYLSVLSATCWNSVPNVEVGVNDQFKITYSATDYTVTIPTGLYSVDSLSAKISTLLFNLGLPEDLIILLPDNSEQKVVIDFNYATTQIDFTIANSLRGLLGFDSRLVPALPTTAAVYETADSIAQFNNIEFFYIKCLNLLTKGLRSNDNYSGIMAKIPIDVSAGSQIVYRPYFPAKIDANNLIGSSLNSLTFQLTDNRNRLVNTFGEKFSISIQIEYQTK